MPRPVDTCPFGYDRPKVPVNAPFTELSINVMTLGGIAVAAGLLVAMTSDFTSKQTAPAPTHTVQTSADPTTSQDAWAAGYAGVRPEDVMVRTLPYAWVTAIAILILTAVRFL